MKSSSFEPSVSKAHKSDNTKQNWFPPVINEKINKMSNSISNHYCSLLKFYCESRNLKQVKKLHCHIIKTLMYTETFLLNNLVTTYANLDDLEIARNVFDRIPEPTLFSWNSILSAYSKSGRIGEMEKVFNLMKFRDGVSWNSVISGYACFGTCGESVEVYRRMLEDGSGNLNRITFSTMLVLASKNGFVGLGRQVHGQIMKFGFESYVFVGSPLVDMYAKSGFINEAKRVFDELPDRNVVMCNTMITGLLRCGKVEGTKRLFYAMREKDSITWTAMITGFMQKGLNREALNIFREMRLEGFSMDQFTFGSVLTACGGLPALDEGKQIHAYAIRTGYSGNVFVGSALVDVYCKCRNIKYAETVFKRMSYKNVVSWTAILVGYGQNGYGEDAIKIFCEMQRNGIEPDEFTLGSVISSCANLASLEEGTQFHTQSLVSGFISFLTVSNALITIYGKCGDIDKAYQMINEMRVKDEVSWTALASSYAQFGKANETIDLFETMLSQGLRPDGVTFIAVISACSRAGLVDKGKFYFESMVKDHGIKPIMDHYTCMIDLFSRAGRLEDVKSFIEQMPYRPDAIGWSTLLSSCRLHRNMEIGNWAFQSLVELEPMNPASYILMASIYAANGKQDCGAQLRREMRVKGVKKDPGFSWIKYKGKVHNFSSDDRSSLFADQIYAELENLYEKMIEQGYEPDTSLVLQDIEESAKIKMLNHHSEKLAIAFGLIFIPPSLPIRVVKNLRVCVDCHNATKFISKITRREILVRDAVRYHLFKDGTCSCGDFW